MVNKVENKALKKCCCVQPLPSGERQKKRNGAKRKRSGWTFLKVTERKRIATVGECGENPSLGSQMTSKSWLEIFLRPKINILKICDLDLAGMKRMVRAQDFTTLIF